MLIAEAGNYDARIHHDDVVLPLQAHWQVLQRGPGPMHRPARPKGDWRSSSGG